jgi:cell division protein ZapA
MAHVNVSIGKRSYRMACGDGEEEHLVGLAAVLDERIAELRETFGEIGDQRIVVMAALTVADDREEARRRIGALEAEIAELKGARESGDETAESATRQAAAAIEAAAERIERVAREMNQPTRP